MENKTNWWMILGVVIVVAVLASLATVKLTGNVISVPTVPNGTTVYTQAEVDARINSLVSQISNLTARLNVCCPETGSLTVTSNPSGASLYVDTVYKGSTPLTISNLSVGNHNIQVGKSGYTSYLLTRYINAGSNPMNVTLTPIANQTGNLTVVSNPSNASLYINGSYKGRTPLTVSNLGVGHYTIQVAMSGYNTYTTMKDINVGSNFMNVTLNVTANQTGNLTVVSSPSSASLYVDTVYKGSTPLTVFNLSVGNHNVQVAKLGYNSNSTTKNIYTGSNFMNVTLTPVTMV